MGETSPFKTRWCPLVLSALERGILIGDQAWQMMQFRPVASALSRSQNRRSSFKPNDSWHGLKPSTQAPGSSSTSSASFALPSTRTTPKGSNSRHMLSVVVLAMVSTSGRRSLPDRFLSSRDRVLLPQGWAVYLPHFVCTGVSISLCVQTCRSQTPLQPATRSQPSSSESPPLCMHISPPCKTPRLRLTGGGLG